MRFFGGGGYTLSLFKHEVCAECDDRGARKLDGEVTGLTKERDGEERREYGRHLVDGNHLIDVAHGERFEVADRAARREAREHEEEPRLGADLAQLVD